MLPTVSIVTPAYNSAAHIEATLRNVYEQTLRNFEIIIVDDGSTDDTVAIARRIAKDAPAHIQVRIISQANAGPSAARNAGVAAARAPLVALLDSDDFWAPRKMERQKEIMAESPEALATSCRWAAVGATGEPTGRTGGVRGHTIDVYGLCLRNAIATSATVFRREAFDQAGGFDNRIRTCEDLDLWLRIAALKPGAIITSPEVMSFRRVHAAQETANWRRMYRGWIRVMHKLRYRDPQTYAQVIAAAKAHQRLQFSSASLAIGDHRRSRLLLASALRRAPFTMLRTPKTYSVARALFTGAANG